MQIDPKYLMQLAAIIDAGIKELLSGVDRLKGRNPLTKSQRAVHRSAPGYTRK